MAKTRADHYQVYHFDAAGDRPDPDYGRDRFMRMFGDGTVNHMNFVLFSTSGVHGTYRTIEDVEAWFELDLASSESEDNVYGDLLTVLIVHPRLVSLGCGEIRVRKEDIPLLKLIREQSWKQVCNIGVEP